MKPVIEAGRHSLGAYVERLFRLGGGEAALVKSGVYGVALDEVRREAERKGLGFVSFANYDYLGLARHPEIEQAAIEAIREFGSGALASRVVGGERSVHRALERALADFVGTEDALALVSGFLTNETLISTMLSGRDLLIVDEFSHASILAGVKGTRATTVHFRHNDVGHLEELLETRRAQHSNCLIVVEGLYSMDGDVPDLARILDLKERHRAWVLVDESHSHGVLGARGRGVCEHLDLDPARIDLMVGTLSKTFVSCGGFVAAARTVVGFCRFGLPGYVYSVGIPPVVAATARKAVEIAAREPWRVERLAENGAHFLATACEAGLTTGAAVGRGIVSVLFEDQAEAMAVSQRLAAEGIYAPPIVQIAVPKDKPRIRFFVSAAHERADIERAIGIMAAAVRGPAGAAG